MKKNFFYKVIRLDVQPMETIIVDEHHFPDVASARSYARATPDNLKAFIFRMSNDYIMTI